MAGRERITSRGGYDTGHEPIGGTASRFVFGTGGLETQPGLWSSESVPELVKKFPFLHRISAGTEIRWRNGNFFTELHSGICIFWLGCKAVSFLNPSRDSSLTSLQRHFFTESQPRIWIFSLLTIDNVTESQPELCIFTLAFTDIRSRSHWRLYWESHRGGGARILARLGGHFLLKLKWYRYSDYVPSWWIALRDLYTWQPKAMRVHHICESTAFACILNQHDSLEEPEIASVAGLVPWLRKGRRRCTFSQFLLGQNLAVEQLCELHTHSGRPTIEEKLRRKTVNKTAQHTPKQQFIYLLGWHGAW
jgi:hypothetical protein